MVNVVHKFEYMTICHFHSYVQLTAFTWIQANSKLYSLLVDKQRPGSADTAKLDEETMVDVGDLRFAHTFFNNRRIGMFNIWGDGIVHSNPSIFPHIPVCSTKSSLYPWKKEHDSFMCIYTGWWFGTFFIFPRGSNQPPTSTSRVDFNLGLGQMIPLKKRYPGIVSFGTCRTWKLTTHARPHKSLLVWLLHVFTASKDFIQI